LILGRALSAVVVTVLVALVLLVEAVSVTTDIRGEPR
jgi:hypothetical protein